MSNYNISDKELNELLHHAGNLYDVGTHMIYKYKKDHEGVTDEELICDGADYQLDKSYQFIYRKVNQICKDKKLDGEIDV